PPALAQPGCAPNFDWYRDRKSFPILSGSRPSTVAQTMPLAAGPARFRYSVTYGPYCWYSSVLVGLADHALAMAASSAGEKSLVNSTLGFACLTFESSGPQSGTAP